MDHSKIAVWRAVNSEYGKRLVEIAVEHVSIARKLSDKSKLSVEESFALVGRIDELRSERDALIHKFEEVKPYASTTH
jgi:hypothetical protein